MTFLLILSILQQPGKRESIKMIFEDDPTTANGISQLKSKNARTLLKTYFKAIEKALSSKKIESNAQFF